MKIIAIHNLYFDSKLKKIFVKYAKYPILNIKKKSKLQCIYILNKTILLYI